MKTSKRALLAVAAFALLPYGVAGVNAATTVTPGRGAAAISTAFDSTIDRIVSQRVNTERLAPALATVAREQMQMQFLSLTRAQQQAVMAATADMSTEEAVMRAARVLNDAVVSEAKEALASVQPGAKDSEQRQAGGPTAKLGSDGDLVFVATAGPCRIADSRFWLGALASLASIQIWAYDSGGPPYDWSLQGGTGFAGVGNCAGDVFVGTPPTAAVAIVSVINTTTPGALRAWNGGTTLSGGAVLNWLTGERLTNTTVIPLNRSISAYPSSGSKRDFALNNNSGGTTDFVVDIVGYFIVNQATALECTTIFDSGTSIPGGSSVLVGTPSCPAGYTTTAAQTSLGPGLYTSTLNSAGCRIGNLTGGALLGNCGVTCCRVPGR